MNYGLDLFEKSLATAINVINSDFFDSSLDNRFFYKPDA